MLMSLCASPLHRVIRFVLWSVLLVSCAWLGACSGCDDTQQEPEDLGIVQQDMGIDMEPEDQGERPDLSDAPDQSADMVADMKRPPRRDMPISEFDFGQPDMAAEPFAIEAVVPPSGPTSGGTLIRITGTSISDGTQLLFSGQEIPVEVIEGALIARTPPAQRPGPVSIKALGPDGESSSIEDGFTYVATLAVESITPSLIPVEGGVEVEVRGQGFDARTAVTFGGTSALRVEVVDEDLMRVMTPPHPEGVVDVRVTAPSNSVLLEDAVTYFARPALDAIDPASGPVAGGNLVTLFGQGFETGMSVFFGDREAVVEQVLGRRGEATVRVPVGLGEGAVNVRVATSRGVLLEQDAYLYVDAASPPRLGRITPTRGPVTGGQEAIVTGHRLDETGVAIAFDTLDAQLIDVTPSSIKIEVPAGASVGAVDVVLSQNAAELDRLTNAYTYFADFALDQLSPASGLVAGGTQVTLSGQGLDEVERVLVGGLVAEITARSAQSITLLTPAHTAGVVDVIARSAQGLERRLEDAFTYTESMEVWSFTPSRGALSGGTYVEVRGRGFDGALSVQLGNVEAPIVRRIDRNNLYLYTPPGVPGEVDLTVSNAMSTASAPYPFLYFNPASRFGGASGSQVDGAVNVSVLSTSGAPIEKAFVMLSTRSDTRYQGLTDGSGMVTLSGPDVLGAQSVTATAAGYSSTTVQSIDAENITIFLNQSSPSPGGGSGNPPPFGIIRGHLTNAGKLADPDDESSFDLAIVGTTSVSGFGGNPNPGDGSRVLGSGPYEITTRIGDLAVIALCGVFNENTQVFDPQFMAVARYIVVSDQGVYDVDLECDIPLDQSIDIKLINPSYAPTGPTSNRATVLWNFGFEGFFAPPVAANSLASILTLPRQPALMGDLADISFELSAGSFTDGFAPSSQTGLTGITDISSLITMPPLLDVPEPVSPQPQGVIQNNQISWQSSGPYFPDMHIVVLRNAMGIPIWTMTVPGNENSVTLPEFPDFSALPVADRPEPLVDGPLFLSVTAVRIPGFQYENFTYQDFSTARWEANAVNRWSVSFPE